MNIKIKKAINILALTNIILGTTACNNGINKQTEETIIEAEDLEEDTKGCSVINSIVILRKKQNEEWYDKLNQYIKENKLEELKLQSEEKENFDLSKIDFSNIKNLYLEGEIDISKLPRTVKDIDNIYIYSDCNNIDKLPKVNSLYLIKTDIVKEDITNILINMAQNETIPDYLSLRDFSIDNIQIPTKTLNITYTTTAPQVITVNTNNLSLSTTKSNNYPLPTINGNYNNISISGFNTDINNLPIKNSISISNANINNTSINELIQNKIKIDDITFNNDESIHYFSKNNPETNTLTYYQVSADYLNNIKQNKENELTYRDDIYIPENEVQTITLSLSKTLELGKNIS